jgi:hypothetical protein
VSAVREFGQRRAVRAFRALRPRCRAGCSQCSAPLRASGSPSPPVPRSPLSPSGPFARTRKMRVSTLEPESGLSVYRLSTMSIRYPKSMHTASRNSWIFWRKTVLSRSACASAAFAHACDGAVQTIHTSRPGGGRGEGAQTGRMGGGRGGEGRAWRAMGGRARPRGARDRRGTRSGAPGMRRQLALVRGPLERARAGGREMWQGASPGERNGRAAGDGAGVNGPLCGQRGAEAAWASRRMLL